MSVTEPLRHEHADLLPHLADLDRVAAGLGDWRPDTPARLDGIVGFLRGHLVPHARAEEVALYPRVEQAMGAPGATDTMTADHAEIVRRIDALAATVATVGTGPASAEQTEQLRAQLYGLAAILVLHFRKEEDVLLPVLDARLSPDDARAMFAEMAAVAHPHPGGAA
ncbi:MAG TPA: hemerythrin domain-containing protein [Frankiaceae bacterium]|nr:hemerythrin domain-containing protein [Frankiaceae bacterium]